MRVLSDGSSTSRHMPLSATWWLLSTCPLFHTCDTWGMWRPTQLPQVDQHPQRAQSTLGQNNLSACIELGIGWLLSRSPLPFNLKIPIKEKHPKGWPQTRTPQPVPPTPVHVTASHIPILPATLSAVALPPQAKLSKTPQEQ